MLTRSHNESGMILVVVTMMVIVLSVVMVGLVGRNYSFVLSSEEQLRRAEAELVAKGAFWRVYQGNLTDLDPYSETIEGRTYTVQYVVTPGVGSFVGTDQVDVQVTY